MKKIFAVIAVLLCAVFGRAQAPINETLLPTVMGFKFGTSSFDVEYSLGKKYQISKDDKGVVVSSPLVFGRKFSVGVFEFDAYKLSQCQFIYYAKDVEDADRFFQDMKGVLGRKYGEGVAEEKQNESTVKAFCYGKHCQGGPYACALYMFRDDSGYCISLFYMPVKFNASTANTASVAKGKLPEVLGVMMGEDAEEVYKSLLRRYGFQRVMLTDNGEIQVNDPVLDGITYEAAFFSIQKNKNVVNSVCLFKSTYNATTAKIYHEQVNDKQVELYGEGKEIPTTKTGVIQRIAYGKHYNQNKHSHFVELFYDDVAGYMICLEYENIFF